MNSPVMAFIKKYIVGAAVPVLVVLGGMWTLARYTIRSEIQSETSSMGTDVAVMKTEVSEMQGGLAKTNDDTMLKDALERVWPRVTSKSDIHGSLERAESLIQVAKHNKVTVDSDRVQRLGLDVLELVNFNPPEISPHDWTLVNDLFSYYSVVNRVNPKFLAEMKEHSFKVTGQDRSVSCITADPGAHDYEMDSVEMDNCTLHLSKGLEHAVTLQNAIFRNVTVTYEGGHIILNNVAFIDCTFKLSPVPQAKRLGETLLAENQIRHIELP